MKTRLLLLSLVAPLVIARFAECHAQQLWMSGYITSWCLNMTGIPGGAGAANYGTQPYDKIDLDAMTHLIAFAAGPDSMGNMDVTTEWDGSNTWGGSLLLKRRKPFNDYVHAHGKAILCCFFSRGGGGDWTKIMGSSARRRTCIRTIIDSIIVAEHYDGVDFDLEPVGTGDTAATRSFIAELRDSLNLYHAWYDASKKPLITAATYTYPDFWARCAPSMDQVNIMTYDMFGTWCTRVWHNCPVYAGPDGKDIYGNMLTSVQNKTQSWINAGVPRNKVGLGIGMNGHIWKGGLLANGNGITAPLQQWVTAPTEPSGGEVMYYALYRDYLDTATSTRHYDSARKVPYISIDLPGNANDTYITFEDTSTMRELVTLADTMNIGGAILWDPAAGYLSESIFPEATHPGLVRDPLLQAVKSAEEHLVTSAGRRDPVPPADFRLWQNFPNPFNPVTTIHYRLPSESRVTLTVYDVLGHIVATLIDGDQPPGERNIAFDGSRLASGLYMCRIRATAKGGSGERAFGATVKMILLR